MRESVKTLTHNFISVVSDSILCHPGSGVPGVEATVCSRIHTANRWKCSGAVGVKRQMDLTAEARQV